MPTHFSTFLTMAPCRRLQFNLSDLYPVPRLGIGALASYLRAHGFERVETRDIIAEGEWTPQLVDRFARLGAPDLLGISVTILSLREAFAIARAVKKRFPDTRVVVGGPGVGFTPEALMRHGEAVDYFVRGEGEGPMLELVRTLSSGSADVSHVPALIWRDDEGQPRENPAGPARDLDDGIFVDYEGQPMDRYRLHPPMGVHPPATMVETARGCSYRCDFCCLSMPVRYRSPAEVEREVSWLMTRFGIREVHFVDPTFTLHPARTDELVARLSRLGIHWSCKTRVDHLDEDLARRMAAAGCYLIAFGVESGEDSILGALGKTSVAQQAFESFAHCRRFGIRTTAYLLLANPGEDDATVERTTRFVRELEPDYVLYDLLQADPMNPLTRSQIAAGLFSQDDLERYYLTDEATAFDERTIAGHPMDVARGRIKRASSDFYVRPKYFYERVRDLRTIQDARNLGAGGSAFLRDLIGVGRLWGFGARDSEGASA